MPDALDLLRQRLSEIATTPRERDVIYTVPGLWLGDGRSPKPCAVDPAHFYLERIESIEDGPRQPVVSGEPGGGWSRRAVIYNTLVRAATGYDHDGDGQIAREPIGSGWMETGTFLKTIATLPLIKYMGFNTIHLLPITAIGDDGHKGTLGSVYAIQNPYRLDSRLSEPVLGLTPEQEFRALIEAAHHLGLRVVVEFAFRTASKDADWVREHPEWFYWIKADVPDRQGDPRKEEAYGAPVFTEEELDQIKAQVNQEDFSDLAPPHPAYREMFTSPPQPKNVDQEDGSWIGTLEDGTRVRIPGAFADWPPDDPQPPWTDVTYLRMYDHPDFNYMAYNTLRMYDRALARPENRVKDLWQRIIDILPYYQRSFGIDGVMIDMGHALPGPLKQRIIGTAREIDSDFAFWDENFDVTHESREEGYNAVIGNFWWLGYRPEQLIDDMLHRCARSGYPLPFFAAPESHNTPRAAARPGGTPYGRLLWALGTLLPALPFCHAGFEIAETVPVNTGLDFSTDELDDYSAEALPLFSQAAYAWDTETHLVEWIRCTLRVRRQAVDLITDSDPVTFDLLPSTNDNIWAVVRVRHAEALCIVFNVNWRCEEAFCIRLPTEREEVVDQLSDLTLTLDDGRLATTLGPARCILARL